MPSPDCTAIIVAAGSSRRMGMDKLLWELDGTPVLRRSIDAFLTAPSITTVIVVCPEERWKSLAGRPFAKPVVRVDGGLDRQDSVASGLAAADPASRLVAVHDGARPLVSPDDIERCIAAARKHRAAALARRATETMNRSDSNNFSSRPVCRENLWCMETPQVFDSTLLRDAYSTVRDKKLSITDEVSALQAAGIATRFIESSHPNLKITTPADLALAQSLTRQSTTS